MKKIILALFFLNTINLIADTFNLSISKKAKNVYKIDGSPLLIITKYCYESEYGNTILVYSKGAHDNRLIFNNGQSCDISDIINTDKQNNTSNNIDSGNSNSNNRKYTIDAILNDETLMVNGSVYKAKTYCLGWNKGNEVIFLEGSAYGVCTSAVMFNITKNSQCNVWCE